MRALILDCDAVAALREASGGGEPRLAAVALAADLAGADGVRLSANESLRPVGESDLHDVRRVARVLELRLAPTPSLLKLALEVRPDRVILSSEPTGSKLRSAPLEAAALRTAAPLALRALREAGIPCWARIAPDADSVKLARAAEMAGVELATTGLLDLPDAERADALERLGDAGRIAAKLRLALAASGAIERARLPELIAAAPSLERVVVGRAWSARALLVGLDRSVAELREALR
jgi:pyridoxine 5'-phosphate synthase PdxJ